jgi:hypothetical protein
MKHFYLLLILFLAAGCGGNPLGTVKVSGTVSVDDQPMEGVMVTFSSLSGDGVTAVGTTGSDGSFTLTTTGADFGSGAIPGQYAPIFSKTVYNNPNAGAAPSDDYLNNPGVSPPPVAVDLIPSKYANPATSGIEPVTVEKSGKNHFEFKLSSK